MSIDINSVLSVMNNILSNYYTDVNKDELISKIIPLYNDYQQIPSVRIKYQQLNQYLCLNSNKNFIPVSYLNYKSVSDLIYIYNEMASIISREVFCIYLEYFIY